MSQLSFQFAGSIQRPVEESVREEYLRLRQTSMRCLTDLKHQLLKVEGKLLVFRLQANKELARWHVAGMLMVNNDEQDERVQLLNAGIIRAERVKQHLEEQILERERFEYLRSIVEG